MSVDIPESGKCCLLQVQNDLEPIDILFGVLTIPLGRTMGRDQTLVFKKANL